MTSFSVVVERPSPSSVHRRVLFYAGPDADHRAFLGALMLRTSEAEDFILIAKQHEWPVTRRDL